VAEILRCQQDVREEFYFILRAKYKYCRGHVVRLDHYKTALEIGRVGPGKQRS